MSLLPISASLSRQAVIRRTIISRRNMSRSIIGQAEGYDDGNGDPRGENPSQQGSSNARKHKSEHPGPESPSVRKGIGAGLTKGVGGTAKRPEDASAQSGGSRSKEAEETGSSPTGGKLEKGGGMQKYDGKQEQKQ